MTRPESDIDRILTDAADRFGTPSYVYLTDLVEDRIAALESAGAAVTNSPAELGTTMVKMMEARGK